MTEANTLDAPTPIVADTSGNSVPILKKLTDAQVFACDPEDYTIEHMDDTVARLTKIVTRYRRARDDASLIAEQVASTKKLNVAARKKKATSKPANLFETKVT